MRPGAIGAGLRIRGRWEREMKSLGNIRRDFAPWNKPDAKPYIQFKDVTKRFGDFVAVNNLTLSIYEREFFALLGASGCGKSTLMRMLAGFEEPTSGQILLDGQDLRGIPPYRRPVNMMFQSYALFPHMSVEAEHRLRPQAGRHAQGRDRTASPKCCKLVKLSQFAKRKPHQLSGGQRQRVALARAVAKRPKVLLLDEPLGALDKKLREETQFELMDLQQTLGLTFLVVTHDQEEAMTMADRIAILDKGEVMQVATPAEVYEAPNSRFVADFVGNINMFEGKVADRDGAGATITSANGVTIRTANAGDAAAGSEVAFAIRPEKIKVSSKKPEGGDNVMEGEIYDIAYLGDMTIFHVQIGNGQVVKASSLNATRATEDPLSWDDKAWISFRNDAGVVLTR
jgi:putrescine transport system ATP-binding protein